MSYIEILKAEFEKDYSKSLELQTENVIEFMKKHNDLDWIKHSNKKAHKTKNVLLVM